ncbi:MAG: DUF2332 domain-containing protein [Acidimicrobiales bacterium]
MKAGLHEVDEPQSEEVAQLYRGFSTVVSRESETVYARICDGASQDPFLISLLSSVPRNQRRPNFVLAAVHFLLLKGASSPLASYFPTVQLIASLDGRGDDEISCGPSSSAPSTPAPPTGKDDPGNPFTEFRSFCKEHENEIATLLATRATQTNEIGRCAGILPALEVVTNDHVMPLSLVDLGSSAGLNLLFDHYGYNFGGSQIEGAVNSRVRISCEVRHGVISNVTIPSIASRVGVDRRPIDLSDEEEALWLLACQWPQDLERFNRLRLAIDLARELPETVSLIQGDLLEELPDIALSSPFDTHLCVMNTWVGAYLSVDQQERLRGILSAISYDRPVSWLFAESPYETPGFAAPASPGGMSVKGSTALVYDSIEHGVHRARRLADMHPHGKWIHWWNN